MNVRIAICLGLAGLAALSVGQDRWPTMPGYKEMEAGNAKSKDWKLSLRTQWVSPTKVRVTDLVGAWEYDVTTGKAVKVEAGAGGAPQPTPQQNPERGRQFTVVKSADGKKTATYKDGNVYFSEGDMEFQVTHDGDLAKRIKYGTASWVYGEELEQRDAMGFSPDGKWLWYYRFDESQVPFYYLAMGQLDQISSLDVEAYPKPGTPNPKVDLYVFDVEKRQSSRVKVRDAEFDNGLGHYVYGISWLADSSELLYHRMDRRQKVKEVCAYDPAGKGVRSVDKEENPAGWVEFGALSDMEGGRARQNTVYPAKFLFQSEADGFINIYELDVKAGKRRQMTKHTAEVVGFLGRFKDQDAMYYMVGDGKTPYNHQIYRSKFDGSAPKRLTDPNYTSNGTVSPDGKYIAVTYQTDQKPPFMVLYDQNGKELWRPQVQSYSVGAGDNRQSKWFSFPSLDGTMTIWGKVSLPSTYKPGQKLPVLFSVYGGPIGWSAPSMRFDRPSGISEAGFAIVDIYSRGGNGRGRAFRQAIYHHLGKFEIDDMAAGATALKDQEWADPTRVGIFGTSYGGYSSAMCILRYPNLFQAASASSAVTDWKLYDSTYTERYMDLLENNPDGYAFGSCMTYVKDLKGWLMIYYGSADNNVHPANAYQLSNALLRAGKYHEMQVGADQGHTGLNFARMMEFFTERLILNPKK